MVPKQAHASLADLAASEVRDLAAVLQEVIVRYDNLWRMSFPYVMSLHQAPTDGRPHDGFHFHVEFHPPLRKPNLLKYLAGPEVGGGSFLSDTCPEEKAAELRAVPAVHYKRAAEPALSSQCSVLGTQPAADPREQMPDVSEFVARLRDFFAPQRPITVARAPGRLDVMGGIADYSGSLVLQLPLGEAALVAMQPADDDEVRVVSLATEPGQEDRTFALRRGEFESLVAGGYDAARRLFGRDPATHWAAYVVGALLVLAAERGALGAASASWSVPASPRVRGSARRPPWRWRRCRPPPTCSARRSRGRSWPGCVRWRRTASSAPRAASWTR